MVVDSILQFMSQMDETVLALMDDYDDFYMIMKNNRGIHPIDLQKSIKRLYRSNKIRKSKYIRIMASASNTNIHGFEDMPDVLPVPHILDYDWRFSRQGLEYMANAVKKIIKKKNAVIVFLGAPTLFRYCYNKSFLHAKLVLVDINADKHSIGIDPNRALCINCNLNGSCTELLSIHADIVVMDPPWYLNYYQLFFDRAAIMSALDTQIMCIMPPKFTRAKTESETYSLLEMIKKDYGFVKKHYFTGVVTYHTPPYEQNVLKTNGIYCNPENWRIGDLLIVEKVYNVITTCTHDVSIIEPEWDEACVNNIRIKYRTCESKIDNYNIELERIFNDDIYPSVKRSFGGKKTINVWTSGNRVFWCNNMAVLKMILRNIDRDIFEVIVKNGYRIPNKEELEQLEKIQGKLLDVIRLEAEEYGSSWRIAI